MFVPVAIKMFVEWMNSPDSKHPSTSGEGWIYGSIIFVCSTIRVVMKRRSMFLSFETQYKAGILVRSLVYQKFKMLSTEAIRNLDVGKVSNTLSSDIWQI